MYGTANGLKAWRVVDVSSHDIDDEISLTLENHPYWTVVDIKFAMIMDVNQTPYREALIIYRGED